MIIIDPTHIRDNVNYSFGDLTGAGIFNWYVNSANINNKEFIDIYNSLVGKVKYMTLFIDNIRLYDCKKIIYTSLELQYPENKKLKDQKIQSIKDTDNNLLKLCSLLKDMKFIIFTGFEDTPIEESIYEQIPDNVITIYASNAITFGGKIKPMPVGVQRPLHPRDTRNDILLAYSFINWPPKKLLYINHTVGNNPDRKIINEHFKDKPWTTIDEPFPHGTENYIKYLMEIKNHKFMICASGNAIGCECHRDWEVLYMRRVPIVIRSKYIEEIFKEFPVLMVNDFSEITEELLIKNDHLYKQICNIDMTNSNLNLEYLFNSMMTNAINLI